MDSLKQLFLTFSDQQSAVDFYLLPNIIPLNNPSRSRKRKQSNSGTENDSVKSPADRNESSENLKNNKQDSYILVIPVNIIYLSFFTEKKS